MICIGFSKLRDVAKDTEGDITKNANLVLPKLTF